MRQPTSTRNSIRKLSIITLISYKSWEGTSHSQPQLLYSFMPSEKMKYILRRAAKSAMRTDIPMSPLKEEIESIFNPNNIDDDCDTIDSLLRPYQLKLDSLMSAGKYHEAFQCFYEI